MRAPVLALVIACAGCGESPPATTGPCASAAITKGPWTLRASSSGASLFFETRDQGCVEASIRPESDAAAAETIVKGTATKTTVTGSYGVGQVMIPDEPGTWYVNQVDFTGLAPGACYR